MAFPKKDKTKKDKKERKSTMNSQVIALVSAGALLFGVVIWIVLSSTRSIVAVVPNQTILPGVSVTQNMLKTVNIPANTPSGYITDSQSLIGQKVKVQVNENQLLYATDVQTSFNMFGNNVEIPKNYILTTINVPDTKAVSGLISAGDSVDLAGVPSSNYQNASAEDMEKNLGGIAKNSFGAQGVNGYWVLSNVKILQSYKSQAEQANVQSGSSNGKTQSDGSGTGGQEAGVTQGSYVVALSYADYKKLLIAQQYLDLYMNIGPKSGFNADLMKQGDGLNELKNAQDQDGNKNLKSEKTDDK